MPTLDITPSGQACGATVHGADLRQLDDADVAAIRDAWLDHKVLAFPDQQLSDSDLEAFTLRFGPFGDDPFFAAIDGHPARGSDHRGRADETSSLFAENWHADWSFQEYPPDGTCLYGKVIPPTRGRHALRRPAGCTRCDASTTSEAAIEGRIGDPLGARRLRARRSHTATTTPPSGRCESVRMTVDAYATQTSPVDPDPPRDGRRDAVLDHRLHHRHRGHGRQRGPAADLGELYAWQNREMSSGTAIGGSPTCS